MGKSIVIIASVNEKMFLPKRAAERCMLLITRLPSMTTLGIEEKSIEQNKVGHLGGYLAS